MLGSRRKSRIGGVGCIAGRETRPLRQQSEKDGFFLDERARRSWNQKSALQWRHVKVLYQSQHTRMFPLEITKKMKDNEKKNMDDIKYKKKRIRVGEISR